MHNETRPSESAAPIGPLAAVAASMTSMAAVLDRDPADLSRTERQKAVLWLAKVSDQIEAATARLAAAGEAQGDHLYDGTKTAAAWLTHRSDLERKQAGALVKTGRTLRVMPATESSYRHGRLGKAKVRMILRAREGLEAQFAADEAELIPLLEPLKAKDTKTALDLWRESALSKMDSSPDDPEPDDPRSNTVRFGAGIGDERTITATLHPLIGREAESIIDSEVTRMIRAGEFTKDDGLDVGQRRAKALLELLRRGSQITTEAGEPKRAVIIQVDICRLLGLPAMSPDELLKWPCRLDDGTVVPMSDVLAVMGDATLNTVLGTYGLLGRFHPVGSITTARNANACQRQQLRARDGGCMFPGCDARASWCQPHHEPPFEQSHQTTVSELVLLCKYHHRLRHHHNWGIDLRADGSVTFVRPDKTKIVESPVGHKIPLQTEPNPPPENPSRPEQDAEIQAIIDGLFEKMARREVWNRPTKPQPHMPWRRTRIR